MTQGLRPKPRVAVALPRAVGVAGMAELAEFYLVGPVPDDLAGRLAAAMPRGFAVEGLERLAEGPSLAARVVGCRYRVIAAPADSDATPLTADELGAAVRRYTSVPEMVVERMRSGGRKQLDVKAFAPALTACVAGDRVELTFETSVGPEGTARPEDLVVALSLLLERPLVVCRAERTDIIVRWDAREETDVR
jgi:radical SAM-linked protein